MGNLGDAEQVKPKGLDVGFLCAGWPPDAGGVESHAEDLARALMTRGHRVHVLCLDTNPELVEFSNAESERAGVKIRRLAYAYGGHAALADVIQNLKAEDAIHAWLAETPCDVIHVQHPTGFGLGALRAISDVGVPMVMTLHDYWALCPRGQMLRSDGSLCDVPEPQACGACLLETWPHLMPTGSGQPRDASGSEVSTDAEAAQARTRQALEWLQLPTRLMAPSEAAKAVYLRAGVAPERIDVCENGIEVDGLAQAVRELRGERAAAEPVRLGVLGSVQPSKGVLELARTFAAAQIENLELEIHGPLPSYHGDSSYVDQLKALASENERVRLMGAYKREDLASILARLDGVAAPSRWEEVFGLSVREARAAGLPVLVSDAGGLPSVAAGGAAGMVVPRDDDAAWRTALERFASDAKARAAWSQAESRPRGSHEMMLQIERTYVETIHEVGGVWPDLIHPIDGLGEGAPEPKRKGFLGRLFGR